ncbi:hypothetical protein D3C85_1090180 [compost metagenome]
MLQHRALAIGTQGQGAQVLGLGPDALGGIAHAAVGVEHGQYSVVSDAAALGIGKCAIERLV